MTGDRAEVLVDALLGLVLSAVVAVAIIADVGGHRGPDLPAYLFAVGVGASMSVAVLVSSWRSGRRVSTWAAWAWCEAVRTYAGGSWGRSRRARRAATTALTCAVSIGGWQTAASSR